MNVEALLQKISEFAKKTKTEVYPVGGFVRDQVLGKHSKDIDFVVIGDGIDFAKNLNRELLGHSFAFFKRFETARFSIDTFDLEFVSAREESYSKNSRKPNVKQTDLISDLSRRDFTINAMAISIQKNSFMTIIDPFNGQTDIKNQVIRTPKSPDISFTDDPLRILRAIRFSSRLGFQIESKTFQSLKNHIPRLDIVSKERIRDEFLKMIESKQLNLALKTLKEAKLHKQFIFPYEKLKHFEIFTSNELIDLSAIDKLIVIAITLKLSKDDINRYLKYYKFSNYDISYITDATVNSELGFQILTARKLDDSVYNHFLFNAAGKYRQFIDLYRKIIISKEKTPNSNRIEILIKIDSQFHYSNLKLALNGKEITKISRLEKQDLGNLINEIKSKVLSNKISNNKDSIKKYIQLHY